MDGHIKEQIRQLLQLQDKDQEIALREEQLNDIPIQREALINRLSREQSIVDQLKHDIRSLDLRRKELELEELKYRELLIKYSNQQLMAKKNEEYQALGREIEHCKMEIDKLVEQQIALLDQIEEKQQLLQGAVSKLKEVEQEVTLALKNLQEREEQLKKELVELQSARTFLAQTIPTMLLNRYERIKQAKGVRVVVGVEHRICGGCHMSLPPQVVVTAQAATEMVFCPNCGRILYYDSSMDVFPKIDG